MVLSTDALTGIDGCVWQSPGINFIDPADYKSDRIAADIQAARRGADLVMVFIHWGPNWSWHPDSHIQRLAHDFITTGADIVFGHSSHHVQGIEVFRGKPIVYGAGGFIDDYALDTHFRWELDQDLIDRFGPQTNVQWASSRSTSMLISHAA